MTTTTPIDKNDSAHRYRPKYIFLGTDELGGTHVYRTTDETIFAFTSRGRLEYRFDIGNDAREVKHYVAHVEDARGWLNCRFGIGAFVRRIAEAC